MMNNTVNTTHPLLASVQPTVDVAKIASKKVIVPTERIFDKDARGPHADYECNLNVVETLTRQTFRNRMQQQIIKGLPHLIACVNDRGSFGSYCNIFDGVMLRKQMQEKSCSVNPMSHLVMNRIDYYEAKLEEAYHFVFSENEINAATTDRKSFIAIYLQVQRQERECMQNVYDLSVFYREGKGTDKNLERWWHYLSLAAQNYFAPALFELAMYLKDGTYVTKNFEQAIAYLEIAASKDHIPTLIELGIFYKNRGLKKRESDPTAEKDVERAYDYFKHAADLKDVQALCLLESLCSSVPQIAPDIDLDKLRLEIFSHYTEAIKSNDASAFAGLARFYFNPRFIVCSFDEGLKLLKQAADKGDDDAKMECDVKTGARKEFLVLNQKLRSGKISKEELEQLMFFYEQGRGVIPLENQIVDLFRAVAEEKKWGACLLLCQHLSVKKEKQAQENLDGALEILRSLAERGSWDASLLLCQYFDLQADTVDHASITEICFDIAVMQGAPKDNLQHVIAQLRNAHVHRRFMFCSSMPWYPAIAQASPEKKIAELTDLLCKIRQNRSKAFLLARAW